MYEFPSCVTNVILIVFNFRICHTLAASVPPLGSAPFLSEYLHIKIITRWLLHLLPLARPPRIRFRCRAVCSRSPKLLCVRPSHQPNNNTRFLGLESCAGLRWPVYTAKFILCF